MEVSVDIEKKRAELAALEATCPCMGSNDFFVIDACPVHGINQGTARPQPAKEVPSCVVG
jgi:hypothetical protein